ncbi:hypothetical protein PENTCL1PPCAC_20570, partial [Pristionchus entomophagus]
SRNTMEENNEIACDISRLPSEVQWMILRSQNESIKEMRSVSKSWKAMIDGWMIPGNLPEIFEIGISEEIPNSINVQIEIDRKDAPCFVELGAFAVQLSERSTESCIKLG